jgi:hypothetical protein
VVLLMMAANKINRAVLPLPPQDDDYVDGRIYFQLAHESARKSTP